MRQCLAGRAQNRCHAPLDSGTDVTHGNDVSRPLGTTRACHSPRAGSLAGRVEAPSSLAYALYGITSGILAVAHRLALHPDHQIGGRTRGV